MRTAAVLIACAAALPGAALAGPPDTGMLMSPAAGTEESGCVACHQVQADPRLAGPVREARQGVHFARGIYCEGCHGGDPAAQDAATAKRADAGFVGARPPFGDDVHLCGRCHGPAARVWAASGHNPAATCATCHGHHGVKKASTDLISVKNCSPCHGYPQANALKTYIYQNTTAIHSTLEQIKKFRAAGGGAFHEQAELEELFEPARAIFHMTDPGRVKRAAAHVRDESIKVSGRVKWLESGLRYRTRVRAIWAVMAVAAALVAAYHITVAMRMRKMVKR